MRKPYNHWLGGSSNSISTSLLTRSISADHTRRNGTKTLEKPDRLNNLIDMEDIHCPIYWDENAAASLKPMLKDAGIEFNEYELFGKAEGFESGLMAVEIIKALGGFGSIAGVLIAWIKLKQGRQAIVKKNADGSIEIITKSISAEETKSLLESARRIDLIDVSTPDEQG
jgi:hypothetical protein